MAAEAAAQSRSTAGNCLLIAVLGGDHNHSESFARPPACCIGTGSTVPRVGLSKGLGNMRSVDAVNRRVLVVDVEQFHAETPHERSLRIIEVLAHSFHEYAARECVRGLFGVSTPSATVRGAR